MMGFNVFSTAENKMLLTLIVFFCICSCSRYRKYEGLQEELTAFVEDKNARIGVAVIINGKDTVSVNGNEHFPMLSVYKLPVALALGDYLLCGPEILSDSILITGHDLKPDTYSPLRDKYDDIDSLQLSVDELLAYSLQLSDNNASDILMGLLPDIGYVNHFLHKNGYYNINVVSTEDDMHQDNMLCYDNWSTPVEMAVMIDQLDKESNDYFSKKIKRLLETCQTGNSRLSKPVINVNGVIGHKTGTGFELPDGRIMAVNDVGYIHLNDGNRYSIAVFIADSHYNLVNSEQIIADISELVINHIKNN